MRIVKLGALAVAFALAGCVSYNSSEDIRSLPPELTKTARIGTITVHSVPASVSGAFRPALEKALRERTTACAKGTVELTLEVSIAEVKVRNVGRAFLIGDSSIVKGQARLLKGGELVADYDISHSVGGGGLLPAAAMAGEEGLADDFAVELCSRAFKPKHR
jgi:hypothetical protein